MAVYDAEDRRIHYLIGNLPFVFVPLIQVGVRTDDDLELAEALSPENLGDLSGLNHQHAVESGRAWHLSASEYLALDLISFATVKQWNGRTEYEISFYMRVHVSL